MVKLPSLERCRFEASLLQRELAEKAQGGEATRVRLERLEEARPPTMHRPAEALGVTPAELMARPPEQAWTRQAATRRAWSSARPRTSG